MTERIKVADYHGRPIAEFEFPDGVVWKLRQPMEADYYRMTEVTTEHLRRVNQRKEELLARANAAAEKQPDDPDTAARKVIDEEGDEKTLPLQYTERYGRACMLAVFIEPEQTPEVILERLGPDIMHYCEQKLREVFTGDAAKKRIAGSSPATT